MRFTLGRRDFWQLDHDHATGATRGLLCPSCNARLGFLERDPTYVPKDYWRIYGPPIEPLEWRAAALAYLAHHGGKIPDPRALKGDGS